jgi:hypothetical protein
MPHEIQNQSEFPIEIESGSDKEISSDIEAESNVGGELFRSSSQLSDFTSILKESRDLREAAAKLVE